MLPHEEFRVGEFYLLLVEKARGTYRLYIGVDGEHYSHYDSGTFPSLTVAVETARNSFDPEPFLAFPYAPFTRRRVLAEAPHAFDSLPESGR